MNNKVTFFKKHTFLLVFSIFLFSGSLFAGIRPDIHDFSSSDQTLLASLIVNFACNGFYGTGNVITPMDYHAENMCEAHTMNSPECLPYQSSCNGEMVNEEFLPWHRIFIADLEGWLLQQGHSKFVPLPAWDPCSSIPPAFLTPASVCSGLFPPDDDEENCGGFANNPFDCDDICDYDEFCEFTSELEGFHDGVHVFVGGSMPNMMLSAGTAIFYIWHAWIDDIYYDWEVAHGEVIPPGYGNIETVIASCGIVKVRVKEYECLESVSWLVEAGPNQSPIPTMTPVHQDGYFYVSFCTGGVQPPFNINATLNTTCGETTVNTSIDQQPSCQIEVVNNICGEAELRLDIPNRFFTNGTWSIESPGYIIDEYYENGYFGVHVGAHQTGNYTITVSGSTPCGIIWETIDIYIESETISLPPFTPIVLCGYGPSNTVCYDLAIYNYGLTGFTVNYIENMFNASEENSTALCLYANNENSTEGIITITPINICGEGEPVTWTIPIYDNCGGLDGLGFGDSNSATPKVSESPEIRLSPNPFSHEIKISLGKAHEENFTIQVFNSTGTEVAKVGETANSINTTHFPPGVYIIRILDENHQVVHLDKLIKQ